MLKDIDESKRSLRYKKWKFALRERQRRRLLESTSEEIDTSSGEERTSEEVSEEIDTSFGEERTSEEVKDVMHKTRVIEFNGRSTSIILQEDNGPCPLLAICNVLLLRNELELSEDTTEISQKFLLSFVHELIKSKNNNKDAENIDDVIPRLATGIDVDITFNGITEFESTRECGVFGLLDIPLYHGWVVDPQDTDTCNAIGSKSYNTLMVELAGHERGTELIEDKKRSEVRIGKNQKTKTPEKDSVDDSVGSVSEHKKAGKGDLEEAANVLTAIIS